MAILSQVRKFIEDKTQIKTKEQQKHFQEADDFFTTGLAIRRPYEINWYRNMAFFLGFQYISWDNFKGSMNIPAKPSWRVRYVDNRIQSNTLHTVAKLSKNKALFQSVPLDEGSDKTTNASEISRKLLLYLQQLTQSHILQMDLNQIRYLYGTCYKMLYWNPLDGERITRMKKKDGTQSTLYEGEVNVQLLSPFEVVWKDGATNIKNTNELGVMFSRPLSYIRERFIYGKYVNAETPFNSSSMERSMQSLLKNSFYNVSESEPQSKRDEKTGKGKGFATIKQYIQLPTDQYPDGRVIYLSNGILLEEPSNLPHKYMKRRRSFGIQKYDYIKLHERWQGETPVNQQIAVQMKINRTHSAIQEIENQMAKPKWLIHKMSQVAKTAIDNEPGEVIIHNTPAGYSEPKPIEGVQIPPTLFKSLEVDERTMEQVSNLHDTSKGMNVPGVESKVAMQFLNEQDQTVYAPVQTRTELCDEEFWSWALELAQEKMTEPRKLDIVGNDNEIELFDFNSTTNFPTKVKVIAGSSFPTSLAAKQQTILNYYMGGAFGKPEEVSESLRMRILTVAEVGDVDSVYKEMRVDIKQAKREHKLWMRGAVTQIKFFDNHQVHIQEHDLFCKSSDYRELERTNPEMAQWVQEHRTGHMQSDPQFQQAQKAQQLEEESVEVGRQDKVLERDRKTEEIKNLIAERNATFAQSQKKGGTPQQTVKQ